MTVEKKAHWATLRAKKNEFDKDFSRFMINKHQNQFQATKCFFLRPATGPINRRHAVLRLKWHVTPSSSRRGALVIALPGIRVG
jgi:hypothetical protein